jgi:hypothetical protein
MIKIVATIILLLLISCSSVPTFEMGEFVVADSMRVDLTVQVARDREISLPILLESGVVLEPNNCDSSDAVIRFFLRSWKGSRDEENILKQLGRIIEYRDIQLSDPVISMPRSEAELLLRKL